jgi:hypothetical protein
MDLHGGRVISHGVDIRNAMAVDEMIEGSGPKVPHRSHQQCRRQFHLAVGRARRAADAVANIVIMAPST